VLHHVSATSSRLGQVEHECVFRDGFCSRAAYIKTITWGIAADKLICKRRSMVERTKVRIGHLSSLSCIYAQPCTIVMPSKLKKSSM
jgi:hypothetical protein